MQLHDDALAVGGASVKDKVPFEPFIGVGPRRYGALFQYDGRKQPDGSLLSYDRIAAPARIEDRDPPELRSDALPYLQCERRTGALIAEAESKRSSNRFARRSRPSASAAHPSRSTGIGTASG